MLNNITKQVVELPFVKKTISVFIIDIKQSRELSLFECSTVTTKSQESGEFWVIYKSQDLIKGQFKESTISVFVQKNINERSNLWFSEV